MPMQKPPREVLDRILKLLALAEGTASVHEAAVASGKAQEMMERYRLDRATLEAEVEDEPIHEWMDDPLTEGGAFVTWLGALAQGIARVNGCQVVVATGRDLQGPLVRIVLVGRATDVAVCRYLFAYLQREIDRLAREALRLGRVTGRDGGQDFRAGAVGSVISRLDERRRAARVGASTTAIVKVDARDAAITRWMQEHRPHCTQREIVRHAHSRSAFYRGVEAGAGIPLHDAVEGQAPRRALKGSG